MSLFIRLCPACSQTSPEYENTCTHCGQFIGLESPVAAPSPTPVAAISAVAAAESNTQRYPHCTLELPDGQRQSVQAGWIIGAAHPSSAAQLQLTGPGVGFVHRQHCQLQFIQGLWQVVALDQHEYGREFTNPSLVNLTPLLPGQPHPLHHGDRLTLAGLQLRVWLDLR